MSELVERLKTELQDEDYRFAYDDEFSNSRIATQIKVLREQQELKQSELAELAGMKQSRISELENVNYNAWSISTLRRLARALGVRLSFAFESWGELLPEADNLGRKALEKPRFEKDPAFQPSRGEGDATAIAKDTSSVVSSQFRTISPSAYGFIQTSFVFDRPKAVEKVITGASISNSASNAIHVAKRSNPRRRLNVRRNRKAA